MQELRAGEKNLIDKMVDEMSVNVLMILTAASVVLDDEIEGLI